MKAVMEAALHAAVVGPIFLMALLLDAAASLVEEASTWAGRFAGETPPAGAGIGDVSAA